VATRAEIEAYIRAAAKARGLDPDFAVAVAKGESGLNPAARLTTKREDSGGVFQLNTKNGLGVEALRAGIDPHDPAQWQRQTDFALDQAKKSWRPWTVARQLQGERVPGAASAASPQGTPQPATPQPDITVKKGPEQPINAGILAAVDPFVQLANQRKEQQTQRDLAQTRALAEQALNQPPPQAPPPVTPVPPVDYATLLMPRIRRGLLADQGFGLLGAP
jgi:soluble lytic murein transglycosylase-like protein